MINHKDKFIFIHIPKTGGTSIESLFPGADFKHSWDEKNKLWKQHCSLKQIRDIYGIKLKDYFTFTFVRNPWDKIVSDYSAWQRLNSPYRHLLKGSTVKDYLLETNGYEDINHLNHKHGRGDHFLSQYSFIDVGDDEVVNFVGKFENFQEDFNTVCDKIGIPRRQLPHKNKSKHKRYTEYYDKETRQMAAQKYAKDIEYFGYEFGE